MKSSNMATNFKQMKKNLVYFAVCTQSIPRFSETEKINFVFSVIQTHHYLEHSSKFHWCLQTVSNWTACFSRVFES